MANTNIQIPTELIVPLNMNGLKGRMLRMPPPKGATREALVIYGHHASLERFYSLAQVINDDVGVTMPDLPGFGGMDSFYTIGEKADLDTMADYLASVIKLRYKKNQRFTILAVSYGFIAATRMLQRYPDIAKRVELLVSVVGFTHKNEFMFSPLRFNFYKSLTRVFNGRWRTALFRGVALNPSILRTFYGRTHNAKHKFGDLTEDEKHYMTEFEIHLWRINDIRTYSTTTYSMFTVDNTKLKIDLAIWHVYVKADNYFNNQLVEEHMRGIFKEFNTIEAPVKNHLPNVIAGKKETSVLVPRELHRLLRKD